MGSLEGLVKELGIVVLQEGLENVHGIVDSLAELAKGRGIVGFPEE